MKKYFILATALSQLIVSLGFSAAADNLLFQQQEASSHIFVNNRILATVNEQRISVIDVMKKMDVQFYRQYPEYTSSVMARYQYYKVHWKRFLQDLIDKELVIADALENKMPITNGDIRQELEKTFGPNIIMNLDKAGVTFDEAWKMMQDEITLRRMIQFRANAKVLRKITPQDVRAAYDEFIKTNQLPEEWKYTVITIRDPDATQGEEVANFIHHSLTEQHTPLTNLQEQLTAAYPTNTTTKMTISDSFQHEEKDLSPAYKEALVTLSPESYSKPISQKSRADKSTVFRIFFLQEHNPGGTPPFQNVANALRDKLADELFEIETHAYLKKLRTHYHVDEGDIQRLIADGFEPFVVR